ncbi:MAG: TetR/AcrR family transcriptional regulator [Rhodococcus sp. (in: high G+C Gram-positive bacteria)]|uniref:TetR/AcrR family transcriptional regulator n=1 Tax=Rhodococcus sp. TaxID=1831 RepID=UPI003BAE508F
MTDAVPERVADLGPRERRRDPARKERILRAAAELIGRRGYHSVSLAEIGSAAGIVGSGIYRHFVNKASVLVALFDQVINTLSENASAAVDSTDDPRRALDLLVAGHVEFALAHRQLLQVYHQDIRNLPDEDRVRLSRKQRLYLEEWVHVLTSSRPGLNDTEARQLVHAAIGAIHSVLFYSSGLDDERVVELLTACAWSCLAAETGT